MKKGWRQVCLVAFCTLVGVFLTLPAFIVIPASFSSVSSLQFPPQGFSLHWYANFFEDDLWIGAAAASLRIAALTTVLAVVLGTLAAFAVVRCRFSGRRVVEVLLISPIVIPIVILAIGIYNLFLRWHLVGSVGGFVLAHTVLAVPFVVLNVGSTLRTFDVRYERAAMSLGAGPVTTFRTVTLPLIMPGVLVGGLLAFLTSFDEIVIAIFLVSPSLQTLPVQMFSSMRLATDPTVSAVSSMLMLLTVVCLVGSLAVRRRSR
jgi:putative spermidine/putrescine transport system permease protein